MRLQCSDRPTLGMHQILLALLLWGHSFDLAAATSTTTKSVGTATIQWTCPSRTINYITHGLPQQCLTSSRISGSESTRTTEYHAAHETAVDADSRLSISEAAETPPSSSVTRDDPSTQKASSDEASPLEGDKFMSFEEWKRQNLKKAGQADTAGKGSNAEHRARKQLANIHTVLDSLGDDAEIDLDFSGFIPEGPELSTYPPSTEPTPLGTEMPTMQDSSSPTRKRSKEAGTTSKERNNYVSFDCGATVLKTNPEAQSAGAVLGENKDYYMLNKCSATHKFLILELCEDILIDTIVLANFEFFSSIFHTFRVSVSDKILIKIDKWKTVGTFEARNSRDVQAFWVEHPQMWARYLRIEFLTHYGSEYYCPVSLVRVHGETMLENIERESDQKGDDDEEQQEVEGDALSVEAVLIPEAITQPISDMASETGGQTQAEPISAKPASSQEHSVQSALAASLPPHDLATSSALAGGQPTPATFSVINHVTGCGKCFPLLSLEICTVEHFSQPSSLIQIPETNPLDTVAPPESSSAAVYTSIASASTTAQTGYPKSTTSSVASSFESSTTSQTAPKSVQSNNAPSKANDDSTNTDRPKSTSATSQAPVAIPTMQESFFKTVQKRLQMLESNSSLSLQYIEDQSRALRDAFNRVEQRQLTKTTTFLEYLNTTVLSELRDFRRQYDQLWQSTVIELEMQRERYERENFAINARLGVLADELVFHKRMAILQMVLIVVCLALVVFSKGAMNTYLELPLVQSVLARSPSSRWLNASNLETPSQSPHLTRTRSAHQLRNRHGILKSHRSMQSDDSIDGAASLVDAYTPPTPTSFGDGSDYDPDKDVNRVEDPKFDPSAIERPSTSPPILPGNDIPPPLTFTPNILSDGDTIDSRILYSAPPQMVVEEATPQAKHLKWNLPDG